MVAIHISSFKGPNAVTGDLDPDTGLIKVCGLYEVIIAGTASPLWVCAVVEPDSLIESMQLDEEGIWSDSLTAMGYVL